MTPSWFKDKNLLAPIFLVLLIFFIPISVSIKSILIILSSIALVFTPFYRRYLYFTFHAPYTYAALALFFYILVASLWSEASFSVKYSILDKYSKLLFLPILAVGFVKPLVRLWAFNSYIAAMLLTCIISLMKAGNLLPAMTDPDPGFVVYNHIITGFMVALGVYFAGVLLFQNAPTKGLRLFYLCMVLLGSYQMLFVNTGITGYVIYGVLISLLILQQFSLKKAVIGIMVFISLLCISYPLSPTMQVKVNNLISDIKLLNKIHQVDTSLSLRIRFHEYAQSLFKKHPIIGVGTGGFQYNFIKDQPVPSWGTKLNEPHSQYWLILSELGLIGMILFIIFLSTLFFVARQVKETKPFLTGILVSFCLLSFSDTIFCYSTIGYLLTYFSALSIGELLENTYH